MSAVHAFSAIDIGAWRLNGRVFKTATSETRADRDGNVTDDLLDFYAPIARAGTPLIITGAIYVEFSGKAAAKQPGADDDRKIDGLSRLAALAHRHGTKIVAQLNHAGRQLVPGADGLPDEALSPSSVCDMTLGTRPRALRVDEIRRLVDAFGAAARRCRDAGFDGVQLQAAHGYLISQFLTPHTNRRDDDYGAAAGPRFLYEVHEAVRKQAGADFPVLLKINGHDALPFANGLRTDALVEVARQMQARGIVAVEVSVGHYASLFPGFRGHFRHFLRDLLGREGSGRKLPRLQQTMMRLGRPVLGPLFGLLWPRQPGFNLRFAARFRQALTIPVICVGGFDDLESINAPLGRGDCDAVSIGRAMIADPQFHRHLRLGVAGPRCDYCNRCLARAGSRPLRCFNPEVVAQQAPD